MRAIRWIIAAPERAWAWLGLWVVVITLERRR